MKGKKRPAFGLSNECIGNTKRKKKGMYCIRKVDFLSRSSQGVQLKLLLFYQFYT